jgi:hypothetical protein
MYAHFIRPWPWPDGFLRWWAGVSMALLGGCAVLEPASESDRINRSAWATANTLPVAGAAPAWVHQRVGNRTPSSYLPTQHRGRPAMVARSEKGDSMLRLPLPGGGAPAGRLRFSWWVDRLNTEANLQERELDDAVVRVILQFDGDRARWSARDQRLSEWVRLATGEPLPHATLMYVWDARLPVGTVIRHPRTDRIRLLVAASGAARLGQWVDIERDVHADYVQAFGKAPQRVVGLALMTDANNTEQPSEAWYGPLSWDAPLK